MIMVEFNRLEWHLVEKDVAGNYHYKKELESLSEVTGDVRARAYWNRANIIEAVALGNEKIKFFSVFPIKSSALLLSSGCSVNRTPFAYMLEYNGDTNTHYILSKLQAHFQDWLNAGVRSSSRVTLLENHAPRFARSASSFLKEKVSNG